MAKRTSARSWAILTASLLGLFLSAWLARSGVLVLGEEHLLGVVYGLPESLRLFFLATTLLGSALVWAVILIILLLKERFDVALRVIFVGLLTYLVAGLAKEFIARPRPAELTNLLQRELLVTGYGFPSAHVALATALALVLSAYIPQKRHYIVPLWIGLVALSRLYLGVHAPLDIVGGFCIGILAATCVLLSFPPHKIVPGVRIAKKRKQA